MPQKDVLHHLQSSVWVHGGKQALTGESCCRQCLSGDWRAVPVTKQKVLFHISHPLWLLLFKLYIKSITGALLHCAQLYRMPEHSVWQPLLADTTINMEKWLNFHSA